MREINQSSKISANYIFATSVIIDIHNVDLQVNTKSCLYVLVCFVRKQNGDRIPLVGSFQPSRLTQMFQHSLDLRMFAGYNFDFSTSGFYLVE